MQVPRDQQELRVRRDPQGPQELRVQGLQEPTARLVPLAPPERQDPPVQMERRARLDPLVPPARQAPPVQMERLDHRALLALPAPTAGPAPQDLLALTAYR